jgi:hypothetical protein
MATDTGDGVTDADLANLPHGNGSAFRPIDPVGGRHQQVDDLLVVVDTRTIDDLWTWTIGRHDRTGGLIFETEGTVGYMNRESALAAGVDAAHELLRLEELQERRDSHIVRPVIVTAMPEGVEAEAWGAYDEDGLVKVFVDKAEAEAWWGWQLP